MVQPYQPLVDEEGEVGLIFLGGAYSHAIHKGPMIQRGAGPLDDLIDNQVVVPTTPADDLVGLGLQAVTAAEQIIGPTTYARVDTVRGAGGTPLLLELELLDPLLFFAGRPTRWAAWPRFWPTGWQQDADRVRVASVPRARTMASVTIDGQEDLDGLMRAGRVVAEARQEMMAAVAPGITTGELDAVGRDVFRRHGARSARA